MYLVADFGNTQGKAALFDQERLVEKFRLQEASALERLLEEHQPEAALIAAVRPVSMTATSNAYHLNAQTPLPVVNDYETPETLGMDRLAGAVGAFTLHPEQPCLAIDAGTSLTFDFITEKGHYLGGSIAPGLSMRFRALHTFTAQLPWLGKTNERPPLTGQNTTEAIRSGVINGMLAEIEQMIAWYRTKYPALQVVLSGGDASCFESDLKAPIFAEPDLVLIGLNRILRYNETS